MYDVSREDARSDLMLSAVVFVFGPMALVLLLDTLGIVALVGDGAGGRLLQIAVTVAVTMLVPALLMKYRGERPATVLSLGAGDRSVSLGLLAAVPLLVATAVIFALGVRTHPLLAVLQAGDGLALITRLVGWLGVLGLALYATVKARDGFGGMPSHIEEVAWRIGRILALVMAGGTVVRILTELAGQARPAVMLAAVLWPLAVAATIWLVLRQTRGAGTTSLAVLLTPTIIAGIGNLHLFSPLESLYSVPLTAGLGLAVGIMAERTRRGGGILLLAVIVALGTDLTAPLPF